MKVMKIRCILNEEALGMSPGDPDLWTRFIEYKKSKANLKEKAAIGQKDELDVIEKMRNEAEQTEKSATVFAKENGIPFFWDYQMRGFFKDSFKALLACDANKPLKPEKEDGESTEDYNVRVDDWKEECVRWENSRWNPKNAKERMKLSNYTSSRIVDQMIFCGPRKIFIKLPEGGEMGFCSRTLRIDNVVPARNTIACSETVPAGSIIEFEIKVLNLDCLPYVKDCLNYGSLRGFGQWRNSGKGVFSWEEVK